MKNLSKLSKKDRKNEKGAALVSVLLISLLLLSTVGALIMVTTTNTANVTDALSEQQAYYAAESGLQTALNVLRGNTTPSPLINSSLAATNEANKIDFKKAVSVSTSNTDTDSATFARLSRWITYNYTSSGAAAPDRVILTKTKDAAGALSYVPLNDMAFAVTAIDPDDSQNVSFTTTATINNSTVPYKIEKSSGNAVTIAYVGSTVNTGAIPIGGNKSVSFGSFSVTRVGSENIVLDKNIPFEITVNMTAPFEAKRIIRGNITPGSPGTITSSSFGSVKIDFVSKVLSLTGSDIVLNSDPLSFTSVNGDTQINGTITGAEPRRLLLKSTGFGPRGAQKQLEVIIQKNPFNNLEAPATLTMVGSSTGFHLDLGNSNVVQYSGIDAAATSMIIPAIGVTNPTNLTTATTIANAPKANVYPLDSKAANVSGEMPEWLQSTTELHETILMLKDIAQTSGGYYASGVTPPSFGNNATATGITFCDGNVSLNKSGGGILVVTGTLTLEGGVNFNGLIIVTGTGGLVRSGGGGGTIQGNTVIAPYSVTKNAAGEITAYGDSFLSPKYDISGGGNSSLIFNSSSTQNGMGALRSLVLAVAEK